VTEETATLRKQLEETARKLKERETRINELEDVRTREGATRKLSKKDRWTFFDSDDE
jgi:phage shock protein A